MSCAMNVGGLRDKKTDTAMKNTRRSLMVMSCVFSVFFLSSPSLGLICSIRSNVTVELDVRTSDDSVDMEAERTRTMTTPKRMSGRFSNIVGMMESKRTLPSSL